MIEVKISLELTKNGVQKSIHAKTGEDESRKAIITLTENGKVFNAEGYNVAVAFDDGTFISSADERNLVVVKNGCIEFTLPGNLIVASGERLCEIQVSNDKRILYSPAFRVLVEKSLGQDGMKEPVGNTIRYQNVILDLQSKDTISEDDEIAVYTPEDELTTKRKISALPLVNTSPELAAVTLVAMLAAKEPFHVSLESPDVASKPDSEFAQIIESASYQYDVRFYYAPSSTGNLEYTEPYTGTRKTLAVKKGKAYCLFVNSADFSFNFQTIDTLEQVEALFRSVFFDYSNPKKLSAFENDLGFVDEKQVSDIVDDEVREYFENNPIEGVGLTEEQAADLAANTEARHTHENKSVLDNLGENEKGDLTYKGKVVGETVEKPLILIEPEDDYATGKIHADIANCITIETSMLPQNARVKKIEIPSVNFDTFEATDEYIRIEDMVAHSPEGLTAPYYIMYPKNTVGYYLNVAAHIVFTVSPNSFYNAIGNFLFSGKTFKIYYEIEE